MWRPVKVPDMHPRVSELGESNWTVQYKDVDGSFILSAMGKIGMTMIDAGKSMAIFMTRQGAITVATLLNEQQYTAEQNLNKEYK